MTNEEAMKQLLKMVLRVGGNPKDHEAIALGIGALSTVTQIKQAIDKHDFPEYLEEDVIDIIDAYYKEGRQ